MELLRAVRALRIAAAVLGVLGLVVVLTFPTDTLVRGALARVRPADGPVVDFRRAVLRPSGLRLEGLVLRRPDGTTVFEAAWIRVRPSLLGLIRGRSGRPWHVGVGICDGTIEADLDGVPADGTIDATWTDLDVATCLPLIAPDLEVGGRTTGTASVRGGSGREPSGTGALTVRDAQWHRPESEDPALEVLHADSGRLHWVLADGRLQVDGLDVRGPEIEMQGGGTVRTSGGRNGRALDLRLTVRPGRAAPAAIDRMLEGLPPAPGDDARARLVVVRGTLDAPQLATPGK